MICALCKQTIQGHERTVGVTHYACEVQLTDSWRADLDAMTKQRDRLRAALVALVGAESREELEHMEAVIRLAPAPMSDKAASIDAIHALLNTAG